ncbi:MAG: DEAD/DEAH box helicase, partial [candidate division WOR-3 bacterium]
MAKKTYLKLTSPIQYIKGIGPKRAFYFEKIGIETVHDLLFLAPRRYVDYSNVLMIENLKINDEATIIGKIQVQETRRTKNRGTLITVRLTDGTGVITLRWFNRPDLKNKFKVGNWLIVSGKVSFFYGKQLVNPLYEFIGEEEIEQKTYGSIISIYSLTEGLGLWNIRRAVQISLHECLDEITETLPASLLHKNNLMPLREALTNLHFPRRVEDAVAARRRLVFDEFFFFELTLARRKEKRRAEQGISLKENGRLTKRFLELLPFQLTKGQVEVIQKIIADMERNKPMNRLLQGDVGSGKTVVALYAMLVAVENGYQAALMAPTEILAEQHFVVLSELLEKLGIAAALLTSSVKEQQKQEIITKINRGELQIILGTHALIEEDVIFKKLGLAVIDEQHRFGVMQRAALVNKGIQPDFLVLSATP